jgi:hypothetical protein
MHGLHAKVNNMAAILKQHVFIVAATIAKALFVRSLADVSNLEIVKIQIGIRNIQDG